MAEDNRIEIDPKPVVSGPTEQEVALQKLKNQERIIEITGRAIDGVFGFLAAFSASKGGKP